MLLIGVNSKFNIEKVFRIGCTIMVGMILLMLIFLSVYFSFFQNANISFSPEPSNPIEDRETSWIPVKNYDKIGSGALSLSMAQFAQFLPNLNRELVVIAQNTRPDVASEELGILIALRKVGQEKIVFNGQPVFLDYKEEKYLTGEPVKFSIDKTPLWIRPLALDQNSVLIEVTKEVRSSGDGSAFEEKTQFILPVANISAGKNEMKIEKKQEPSFQNLAQAKWWGIDQLIQCYGGPEYKEMISKHKIEFTDGDASYFCFLGQGDYLTFDQGRWKVCALDEIVHLAPAAYVKALSSKEIHLQVWDETGFYPFEIKWEPINIPKLAVRSENLLNSVRLRTASQITCVLGKRRLSLRKGDWLLRTPSGWRILKKIQEIEDCLQHKIKGDLFIFDGIQKEINQILVKGNIFDEMRVQMQPVSIPIMSEKKSQRPNKTQKKPMIKRKVLPSSHHPGKIGNNSLAFEKQAPFESNLQEEMRCA